MRSRLFLPTILVVACVALLSGCVEPVPEPVPTPSVYSRVEIDRRGLKSDAALERLVNAEKPGCSAAVAVHGGVLWSGASGLADLAADEPLTTATRFDMASVSKQFTATAILMLERAGSLSLDHVVGRYIDGLPAWGNTITLEQLLHHTSHVRDYWQRLEADGLEFGDFVSHEDTVRAIARLRTLEPGTGYLYSNSNYILLAEVVHRVSGDTLPVFLEGRLFTPLGLDLELSPNLQAADVALSYDDDDQLQLSGWSAYGAVGIHATPSELARWGDQYRDGTVVGDYASGAVPDADGALYGAGITIQPDEWLRADGRFAGTITRFEVSPDRETTIVVMCNGHLGPRFPIAESLRKIWVPVRTP